MKNISIDKQFLLTSNTFINRKKFWKEYLQQTSPDILRPLFGSDDKGNAQLFSFKLDGVVYEKLNALCRQNELSVYAYIITAYCILVKRYTGSEKMCIAIPVLKDSLDIDGTEMYDEHLPLLCSIKEEQSFKEVLLDVRKGLVDLINNQRFPLSEVYGELHLSSLENIADTVVWCGQLNIKSDRKTSGFVRSIGLTIHDDQLVFDITSASETASEVAQMFRHLVSVIGDCVADTNKPIAAISLLSRQEWEMLTEFSKGAQTDYASDRTLMELFDRQASIKTSSIALIYGEQTLSYETLEVRSNQLAHKLIATGVTPGVQVGLLSYRGFDMIIGMFGILKAGGVYVPLNIDYPPSRLHYISQDAGLSHLVYTEEELLSLSGLTGMELIKVADCVDYPVQRPAISRSVDEGAYVMYTSGTSGHPKGILVSQRNILKLVYDKGPIAIHGEDCVLQWSNYAFDGSTYEIYSSLLHGARLLLIAEPAAADAGALSYLIRKEGVSVSFLTTALFNAFVDYDVSGLALLRKMLFGGEKVSVGHVRSALSVLGKGKLLHVYGPTETTVYASCYEIDEIDGVDIPIGHPLCNTEIRILDDHGRAVPVGVRGELYIGGAGVSLGYINNPALTSVKYVRFPDGGVWYRTGDIGRWRSDGEIEFIGRADEQVKVRGYRIEPGEIENVMLICEGVKQAAVVVHEDINGQKQLVAYVVVKADVFDKDGVLSYLRERLPEYMVPVEIVNLDSLPLTPNGKVDRKSLSLLDLNMRSTDEYIAPRNELELKLVDIWEELLGISGIGINSNFFELGGHSLLAIQVVSLIRKEFGFELGIREIFDHPTISDLAERLPVLSAVPSLPSIAAASRSEAIPLSFAQERLWFIDRLQGSGQYHMPWVFRLEGAVDIASLRLAFQTIVARHEILRTVITEKDGTGYQQIRSASDWDVIYQDYAAIAGVEDGLSSFISSCVHQPFDLSADYMLRVNLVREDVSSHVLIVVLHHIAFDGWSIGLLVKELSALYENICAGRAVSSAPAVLQYADYAIWQRNYLSGEALESRLKYWSEQLSGVTVLELPTDYSRPSHQSIRGGAVNKHINKGFASDLEVFCVREGVTMFMLLESVFKVLLYRYSGQTDICLGTPVAGRHHEETEDLIGFFVNTLALRSDLSGNPSFKTFLHREKEVTLGAYAHQDVPFEKVVEHLDISRDLSRTPLFQVMLSLQNTPGPAALSLGGETTLKPVSTSHLTSQFDLTLYVNEEDGLQLSAVYCSDLYRGETIERLLCHYVQLLESVLLDQTTGIGSLNMLSEGEKAALSIEFNETSISYPSSETLSSLFSIHASVHLEDIALVMGENTLSYGALEVRSNQLAHYLRSQGVESGTLVPIYTDRSFSMIVGILGILKAGGAYVPIDMSYPEERIIYILKDTGAQVVVSGGLEAVNLGSILSGLNIHIIDAMGKELLTEPENVPESSQTSAGLAYVIYTSGSTGQPKGVCVPHRGVVNRIDWMQRHYGFTRSEVVLQKTPYIFDVSVWEIFMTLCYGGRLVLCSRDVIYDPQLLTGEISRHGVSFIHFVPGAYHAYLQSLNGSDISLLGSLKHVFCSGEALSVMHVQSHYSKLSCRLHNLYGPTEASVDVSYYETTGVEDVVPIGRPISNIQLYIYNDQMALQPIGVPGELYIGGDGLAAGYLNKAELSAVSFIVKEDVLGGRLYRTGDLARMLPDGNIEFLGRRDDQVKLRGYRIELGEIETVLLSCRGVKEGAVVIHTDSTGDRHLVGYVVIDKDDYVQDDVYKELDRYLPSYMIPAHLQVLDSLPVTVSGKIDRKRLSAAEVEVARQSYAAPRNAIEIKLCEIWSSILGASQIGIDDNFFESGGHSLLAIRLRSRIREELGYELQIRDIFDSPTISGLCSKLSSDVVRSGAPLLRAQVRPSRVPLSYSQERLWFIDRLQGSEQYHMPWVFRLEGSLDVAALASSFRSIVSRHEVLRSVIREEDGVGYQELLPAESWSLEYLRAADGMAVEEVISSRVSARFDLSLDYMLRVSVLEESAESHLLIVVLHHIAFDGWSISVLVRELASLYRSYSHGGSDVLLPLSLQYSDYAIWQRQYLSGSILSSRLSYWSTQLSGLSVLDLPTDHKRPAIPDMRAGRKSATINKSLLDRLQLLCVQEGVTLFILLESVLKVLLFRYSGQEDICIGSPVAGRYQEETDELIGFFINTIVLRSRFEGQDSFHDFLSKEKETILAAYQHQDAPFEKVVEILEIPRDFSRNALFQVKLALQNVVGPLSLDLKGVEVTAQIPQEVTTQLDVEFDVWESESGLFINLIYRLDLYNEATIERWLLHFEQLLYAILADVHTPVDRLNLLSVQERCQLLEAFNFPVELKDTNKTIIDLFEAQVSIIPDEVALLFDGQQMTYRELNEQSNRLGHYLRSKGVREDTLVPICVSRSFEMIVGIIGILKAGGAYVPIDATYPSQRIASMLKHINTPIAVAETSTQKLFNVGEGIADIILLDGNRDDIAAMSSEKVITSLCPENLAYVIFTSGSTGVPKGVMIEHKGVVNLVNNQVKPLGLYPGITVFQFASFGYDASSHEIFCTLTAGGRLVLAKEDVILDTEKFCAVLNQYHVNLVTIPPSYLPLIKDAAIDVDTIISAGESLNASLVAEIRNTGIRLINAYGPTENTVSSVLSTEPLHGSGCIVIGKPLENVQAHILDRNNQLVPVGVVGELYLGGRQVARGYLNQPELTATRFIPDLFSTDANAYLYRTGDLARWLPDGNIEFIGRLDEQIKIRGYRVELGEIETVLLQRPEIEQCIVVVHEDQKGNKQLIAYVVATAELDKTAAMAYLKERLPDFMVPALLIEIGAVPFTPNGKADRKKLASLDVRDASSGNYVAPRNAAELKLADIWQRLLEVEQVSIQDDFFELGGHSLLAIQVVSLIRKEFGFELGIREIFDHPTISDLAERLPVLSAVPSLPSIAAASRSEAIPLSFAQERLWFIDRLQGSGQYHMPWVFRLEGAVDIASLRLAFQTIVARHEILRTVITEKDGTGYQQIRSASDWDVIYQDYAAIAGVEDGLSSFISSCVHQPFDLSADYMLRVNLVREDVSSHVLIVVLHHIAFDGWSIGLLVKELSALYENICAGRAVSSAPAVLQYADYAIWQRNYLSGEALESRLKYWSEQLSGVTVLELPTDYSRPSHQSIRGGAVNKHINKGFASDLEAFCVREGVTMFMLLESVFKVLLYRYSGQTDICLGTPVAGRHHQETEDLIGFFVNTLALRSDLSGNPSFKTFLHREKEVTLGAYAHQDVPFEKVVEHLDISRDLSRTPLFQVMLSLQNTPGPAALSLGETTLKLVSTSHLTSQFDLTLYINEEDGLQLSAVYCSDLYRGETIERLLCHYVQLLESVLLDQTTGIGSLNMLSEGEKAALSIGFNETSISYPSSETLSSLFSIHASVHLEDIALVMGENTLSYGALEVRSNQLAHYLRSQGVESGTLVPIYTDRSFSMIVGILGILKAGGAYVPIDMSYPEERIIYILKDTGAQVVVSGGLEAVNLGSILSGLNIHIIDAMGKELLTEPENVPESSQTSAGLAYVIYTSGSTGQPKGVCVPHRGVVNRIDWMQRHYGFTRSEVVLQKTPYIFDVSVWEIFMTLCYGGRLVLCSRDVIYDPQLLTGEISRHGVSFIHFVPGAYHAYLQSLNGSDISLLGSLKHVFCSGEALSVMHVQSHYSKLSCRLHNLYGPTEASVDVSYYETTGVEDVVPIGRPISNIQLYIYNDQMALQPIGVPGELYIGGDGLAAGYLNKAELSAVSFIVKEDVLGGRLYRTGDLARMLPDGNIEFLGRRDDQVKLRGYRIELGEIETVLLSCRGVKEGAVVIHTDSTGDRHLVGYVVIDKDDYVQDDVYKELDRYLPSYMIPAHLQVLDSLPVTVSGKIDRKRLSAAEVEVARQSYAAPRNAIEIKLCEIWSSILGASQIGIDDNFFESGGHSLLAIRLRSRIREELGYELQIRDIFDSPTISGLCSKLSSDVVRSGTPLLRAQVRPSRVPLSYSQERLWFIDRLQGSEQYHMPWVFRLEGSLDVAALASSFRSIVSRHEVLRSVIREEDGVGYQELLPAESWSLEYLRAADGMAVEEVISSRVSARFDLSLDYMLRVSVLEESAESHLLIVVLHHIAFDGWSISVLVRELVSLYRSYSHGGSDVLLPLSLQYSDYAIWQRQYLSGSILSSRLSYWSTQLSGLSVLDLPTDHPRSSVPGIRGGQVSGIINQELTSRLEALCIEEGVTLFMLLESVFKALLHRYSGQEDICIGTPVAGRYQEETENLIGSFINTLALRSRISGELSFRSFLREEKEQILSAYEHQDVPFEKVVEAVGVVRDQYRNPLFQVLFTLQDLPASGPLDLGAVSLSSIPSGNITSQFDIILNVTRGVEGIYLNVTYSSDLYEEGTMERFVGHYEELLSSVSSDLSLSINKLNLLKTEEQTRVLSYSHGAAVESSGEEHLLSLFMRQVQAQSDSVALVCGERELSYGELDAQSDKVMAYLHKAGVIAGELVPVVGDRSLEMVIGMLGVLKAGCAYVPVDSSYPAQRIMYMLSDTGSRVVLSDGSLSSGVLSGADGSSLVSLEWIIAGEAISLSERRSVVPSDESIAYVIYTSGSTGVPKGVQISHGNLLNYIRYGMREYVGTGGVGSGSYVHLSFSFDASVTGLFVPLLSGRLVVLSRGSHEVFEDVYLRRYAPYDFIKLTPSHLSLLGHSLGSDLLPGDVTGRLIIGGEELHRHHLSGLASDSRVELINEYGPTETTVGVSVYRCHMGAEYQEGSHGISIGRPIDNVSLYILDGSGCLSGIGIPGELYIGGLQVGAGYLNKGEETAARFLRGGIPASGEAVLYRTGDVARWLPDGTIEFLGRKDEQVKLRGYRIELGEIENVLNSAPGVSESVVLLRKLQSGEPQLSAYIVSNSSFDREALLLYLRDLLPEYMIPHHLNEVSEIPLTAHGKVDRERLLSASAEITESRSYVAPETAIEINLAAIWSELLEVEQVGIYDDFFDLGGHSLMAIRVIAAVRKELGIELSIKDLFDTPTIAGLTGQIAVRSSQSVLSEIIPQPEVTFIPLSFAQERLWLIHQLEGSTHYHVPLLLKLEGTVNQGAIHSALQTILQRHEALRSVINVNEDGELYQLIKPVDEWQLRYTVIEEEVRIGEFIQAFVSQPFDLSKDYLLRAALVNKNGGVYVLAVVIHHIASDGWSMSVLADEFSKLYQAGARQQQAVLPVLPVQYKDYAVWQRNNLGAEVLSGDLAYWEKQLKDVPPLELPLDYSRPAVQSKKGKTCYLNIDKKLADHLYVVANEEGVTIFMLLLSAFNILLARYSNQSDICVGTPVAGRKYAELEGLVGLFVNTVVLRSNVNEEKSIKEFIQQIRYTTLEAYSHQDAPLERVIETLAVPRDFSRHPLFQILFVLQNVPAVQELQLDALQVTPYYLENATTKFDMTFTAIPSANGIDIAIEYCIDLFEEKSIERMGVQFRKILEGIAINRMRKIGELPILSDDEHTLVLHTFNDTCVDLPQDKTVIDLFEEQVLVSPHKVAISFGTTQLTYEVLNEKATRLSVYLRKRGVKETDRIAICIDRSVDMIVSVLAIMKSGCPYVPIDPAYPKERITYMLQDIDARMLISNTSLKDMLGSYVGNVIFIDEEITEADKERVDKIERLSGQDRLTYIIYTSGSTGKPKGIEMPDKALFNLLLWQQTQLKNKCDRRILQFASICFDASFQEIFMSICFGGTIFLIEEERRKDMRELLKVINEEKITHLFIPYVVLKSLSEAAVVQKDYPVSLEEIFTAGEQLKLTEDIRLLSLYTGMKLLNYYGPSETHVVTAYEVIDTDYMDRPLPPIGKPIGNTRAYILNRNKQLCGIGMIGELYLGGIQVARGYLNKPALSAERFIPDPFYQSSDNNMYKTGDICRWLPDGNIEFLGRGDDQIKIRGFRVELGEIESVLLSAPGVQQSTVLVREDKAGSKRIIGYVVANQSYERINVMQHLRSQLPDYMVPFMLIKIDAMPLTNNGKVNKKELPAPDFSDTMDILYVSPRSQAEYEMLQIWEAALGVDKISIHSNFFELGGYSFLAMRIALLISKHFGKQIGIRDVFMHPTIAELVRLVDSERDHAGDIVPIGSLPRPSRIPLSYSQERLWFIDRLQGSEQYHMPWVFRLEGSLDVAALASSFRSIVSRHEVLRSVIREEDGVGYQELLPAESWSLEYLRAADGMAVEEVISSRASARFDLSLDYMLRVSVLEESAESHLLIVVLHHIAFDGWSISVLVRELVSLYRSYSHGGSDVLLPLSLQYGDYAIWQRQYLSGSILSSRLSYWSTQLSGLSVLDLPTDHPRSSVPGIRGGQVSGIINQELTSRLEALCIEEGVTLFMLLESVFKALLHRYSGQEDICIGTPVAGRYQEETENLIGSFINTLALRSRISGELSFRSFLREEKEQILSAYEHQDVPFEKVVEAVGVVRDQYRNPLFQVLFTLQDLPASGPLDLGAVSLSSIPSGNITSQFDIILNVTRGVEGIYLNVTYSSDLYEEGTMERFVGHYEELLSSVSSDLSLSINKLNLLKTEEQTRVLSYSHGAAVESSGEEHLLSLFMRQVEAQSDSVALVCGERELSYGELDAQSDKVMAYLHKAGVIAGELVPVVGDRSMEMVIGMLGVLKAGCAYVPVDSSYPAQRIMYMLSDTGSRVVLSDGSLSSGVLSGAEVSSLVSLEWIIAGEAISSSERRSVVPSDESIAYVIYTSGSTGVPKGVQISHGNLLNYIRYGIREYVGTGGVGSGSYVHLSFSFDASVTGLFVPLLSGRLVVLSRGSGHEVFEDVYLRRYAPYDFIKLTPSHLSLLGHSLGSDLLPGDVTGRLIIGGEELHRHHLSGLASDSRVELINEYGPTETTVGVSVYRCHMGAEYQEGSHGISIGRPIDNVSLYILDGSGCLSGIGIPGELYIGGLQVGAGYLNKGEETAARFLRGGIPASGEAVLYRTGDVARWLPDGTIEFLGRKDEQVKLRGYRIELGEIENVLNGAPGVSESVVLLRKLQSGEPHLSAYIVSNSSFDREALLLYLRDLLPEYMIPHHLNEVSEIPLTAHGKVDRERLLSASAEVTESRKYVAPETAIEINLAAIWSELLEVEQVGIYDDFFDLGGHSLMAIRVIASIRKDYSLELPIHVLFELKNISDLSKYITLELQ
ncbi:non-ribosomal peptide synthetase [Chitinophaga pinensis]|uniref:Amino acid adenylation domain protein n=1 Tax=Chitinophaga pinensis (strain ATCC 43595 / DSM 2588 / LMG 13176 / NBRC 15968 / NCIMB 11800 / UQM 2034) TaxID=485918 RepID=A0A979G8A7_CHIPD|nr:non-ribosomal peptide synthetase [Chitinophaga pinensis]ACU62621.1 amino acid adenylation domain protein [Chitinophaga pinensis DSM 2588]